MARLTLTQVNADVQALKADVATLKGGQDEILALLRGQLTAQADAPAKVQRPAAVEAKAEARTTKPLTLKAFRAMKATKKGAKAYAGVSRTDVLAGRAPMPAGFHAPTGERKAAIQAWKAAQAG